MDQKSDEAVKAKAALFKKHPAMKIWDNMGSHDFYVARLNIEQGLILINHNHDSIHQILIVEIDYNIFFCNIF